MTRIQILNYLANTYQLRKYLEIGVQTPSNCFLKVNVAKRVGVDPEVSHPMVHKKTSDDFFKTNKETFDLIFIDGLHEYTQVKRDLLNSLKYLSKGGFIVIHDTLPTEEKKATYPRESKEWYGDVYKLVLELHNYCRFITINTDCGVTICVPGKIDRKDIDLNWTNYVQKKEYLNIVSLNDWTTAIHKLRQP